MRRSRLLSLLLVALFCTAGSRARQLHNGDFSTASKRWDDFSTAALSASSYASLGIQPSGFVSDTAQGQGRHALPSDQPRKVIVIGCSGDGCSSGDFAPGYNEAEVTFKQSTYGSGNLYAHGGYHPAKQNLVAGSSYGTPSSYGQYQATGYYSSSSSSSQSYSSSSSSLGSSYNAASSYGAPAKASSSHPAGSSYNFGPSYSAPAKSAPVQPYSSSGSYGYSSYGGTAQSVPSYSAPKVTSSSSPAYSGNSPSSSYSVKQNAESSYQSPSYNSAASYGSVSGYGQAPSKQYGTPASSHSVQPVNAYSSKPAESSPSYQAPVKSSYPSYDSPASYGSSVKDVLAPSSSYSSPAQTTVKPSYTSPVTTSVEYRQPLPASPPPLNLNYLPPEGPPAAPSYVAPVTTAPASPSYPSPTTAPSLSYGNSVQAVPASPPLPPQPSNLVTSSLKPFPTSTSPPRTTPKAEVPPQSPVIADLPFPGCAAALKCVKDEYCDMLGVMVNTPVNLTPHQKLFRVPLMSCLILETNEVGFCCRDPLYNDPWPADMPMPNMAPKSPEPPVSPAVAQSSASAIRASYQPPPSPQYITPPPVHYLPPTTSVYVPPPVSTTSPPPPVSLPATLVPTSVAECGVSQVVGHRSQNGEAQTGEFPWHALLTADNGTSLCSAALVGEKFAITAAHCIAGVEASRLRLRLGEHHVGSGSPHREVTVSAAISHPDFQEGSLFNDIALIFFKNPGARDNRIGKVCLPTGVREQQTTGSCLTTGWGRTVLYGQVSGALNKAQVPVINRQECESKLQSTHLGKYFKLHQSFTCAGSSSDLNMCKVDDGSPLVCQRSDGSYVVTGLSSWSAARCSTQMPMVYSDVSSFVEWLNTEMNRSEDELVANSNAAFQTTQDFKAQFGPGAGYGR